MHKSKLLMMPFLAMSLAGCGASLSVKHLTNGTAAKGIVYSLPFTQFESKVSFFIENCGGLNDDGVWEEFKIGTKVQSTPKQSTDLRHVYDIDPGAYAGGFSAANVTIALHEDSAMLKSVNNTVEDQSGQFALGVVETAISFSTGSSMLSNTAALAGISGMSLMNAQLSVGDEIPSENIQCNEITKANFQDAKTLSGEVEKLSEEVEDLDSQLEAKKAEIALISPATDPKLTADLLKLTSDRKAKAAAMTAKTGELARKYGKISYSQTETWPTEGLSLVSGKYAVDAAIIYKWVYGIPLEISDNQISILRDKLSKQSPEEKAQAALYVKKLGLTDAELTKVKSIFANNRGPANQISSASSYLNNGKRFTKDQYDDALTGINTKRFDTYLVMVPADKRHATLVGVPKNTSVSAALAASLVNPAVDNPKIVQFDQQKAIGIRYRTPVGATITQFKPNDAEYKPKAIDTVPVSQLGTVNTIFVGSKQFDKAAHTLEFSKSGGLTKYGYVKTTSLFGSVNKGLDSLKEGYLKDKELRIARNKTPTEAEKIKAYLDRLDLINKVQAQEAVLTTGETQNIADIDALIERVRVQALK